MSVLFAGGELSSFISFQAGKTTTAGNFTAPAIAACSITTPTGFLKTPVLNIGSKFWLHFECTLSGMTAREALVLRGTTGTDILSFSSNGTFKFDGVTRSLPFLLADGQHRIDINFDSTKGALRLYVSEQLVASFALAAAPSIEQVFFQAGGAATHYSQVIIADESTVGWKLGELVPNGAGAVSDWTGSYSDFADDSTSTVLTAATDALAETWTNTPIADNYNVVAVVMTVTARRTAGGPAVSALARIGQTNYPTPFGTIPVDSYGPTVAVLPLNPSNSNPWTTASINAAQFGLASVGGPASGVVVNETPMDFSSAENSFNAFVF